MFKTAAIILSMLLFTLAVFGFLSFKTLGGNSSCGFACPLTNGVFASSASSGNGALAGSAFAIVALLIVAVGTVLFAGFAVAKQPVSVSAASDGEKLSDLVFKKITFWFSLHEASPTR